MTSSTDPHSPSPHDSSCSSTTLITLLNATNGKMPCLEPNGSLLKLQLEENAKNVALRFEEMKLSSPDEDTVNDDDVNNHVVVDSNHQIHSDERSFNPRTLCESRNTNDVIVVTTPSCTNHDISHVMVDNIHKTSLLLHRTKREVSFDSVIIREYGMTLGDHPDCSYGPPVTLDWNCQREGSYDIDDYESRRGNRRKLRQLVMNYYRRCDVLRNAGYSKVELKKVTREVNRTKRQRKTTELFLPVRKIEECVQSAGRKVKRVVQTKMRVETPVDIFD